MPAPGPPCVRDPALIQWPNGPAREPEPFADTTECAGANLPMPLKSTVAHWLRGLATAETDI